MVVDSGSGLFEIYTSSPSNGDLSALRGGEEKKTSMGAKFARAMLPACFPDRPGDSERRNTKNDLKKVFEPDDDNDISQFSEDTAWWVKKILLCHCL